MRKLLAGLGALAALAASPLPAAALFHFAVIDEVMTSHDGNADIQFVEIRMLAAAQNQTANSVLAAFDADGTFIGDILVVPSNVANAGNGVRWLMGTTAFETAAGVQADFEFAPGLVPQSGMICWGGGPGAVVPEDPPDWDRENLDSYVDCVAYGAYTGPTHDLSGTPTPIAPDGHSLRRISETEDNATDFACGDPADPTNNAGGAGSLAATTACPAPPAPFTKGQAKCVDRLHAGLNGVAKASNGVIKSCVAAFQKGASTAAVECIAADAAGKKAKATAKTLAAETKFCAGENAPPYGTAGAIASNSGGQEAAEFALADLFQDAVPKGDLDDALVTKAANAAGAKCQAVAIAQLARTVDGFLKASQRLQKGLLDAKPPPPPGSAADFADALEAALAADPKLAKLELLVTGTVTKACPAFDGLFGAPCNAETAPAGLAACVYRTGACEACLAVGKSGALPLDCTPIGGAECVPQS
jgi:hypothetical protein